MSQTSSSVYRLGRGPALVAAGIFTIAAGILVFATFLLAGEATWRVVSASITGVVAAFCVIQAVRFFVRPPVVARFDADGFTVSSPRARAAWKQVDDVSLDSGFVVLTGEGTARIEVSLLDPPAQAALVREVYDRLNTAHGYTRFG